MPTNPTIIQVSALDDHNGFQINGVAQYDKSGRAVAGAGDVNGDGFADFIIGAYHASPHGTYSGSAYVVFGTASGFANPLELSALNGSNGFRLDGVAKGDYTGNSVSNAGDINGDGFDDIVVGAPRAGAGGSYIGASYVVFGKSSGFSSALDLSALDGSDGFVINGVAMNDQSGIAVGAAGDVNGDGVDDLVIGAFQADSGKGAAYVVFGDKAGFASSLDLSALDGANGFVLNGKFIGDDTGFSVAGAGDINGDGIDDLLIGASGSYSHRGAAFVVFGSASAFASALNLSSLNGSNGFKISGETAFDTSGDSVAIIGDVNGDGFADLLIGAPDAPGGNQYGASYVVFGKAGGFSSNISLTALDGANGFRINGEATMDFSGNSVAAAGDVNGDGFADIIIGAYGADPNGDISGAAYVLFGKAGGFASSVELSALDGSNGFKIEGAHTFDNAGISVAGNGDINRDGFADLIVGARGADPNGSGSGASYVIYGRATENLDRTGTDGNDLLGGGAWDDTLFGLGGRDSVHTGGGDDVANGGGGNDEIAGGSGDDTLQGGGGRDSIAGGGGDDFAAGGSGSDRLAGGNGDDTLLGGSGNDVIKGGIGYDRLSGGSGRDLLDGGAGADRLDGGSGNDTVDYTQSKAGVSVSLATGVGQGGDASGDSLTSIENLNGSSRADSLAGDNGANILSGAGGADTLIGGDGNDTLVGGAGRDILTGGGGHDTFDFNAVTDSGAGKQHDHITDFSSAADLIDVSGIDANAGVGGNQAFTFISTTAFSNTAGELRAVNSGANSLVAADVNGDGHADFTITVQGVHDLAAGDFVL